MSKEKLQEKFYNKLKTELLEIGYLNNDLTRAARLLKKADEKYVNEVDTIYDYLFEKCKTGDGIAYALIYGAHEDKLSKIANLNDFGKISDYFLSCSDLQLTNDNLFFDPTAIYFAGVIGGINDEI